MEPQYYGTRIGKKKHYIIDCIFVFAIFIIWCLSSLLTTVDHSIKFFFKNKIHRTCFRFCKNILKSHSIIQLSDKSFDC